jgi:hypothetical protein
VASTAAGCISAKTIEKWSPPKALCERCANQADPFDPTPDTPEWMRHQLTDESWARWREDNAEACQRMAQALGVAAP